MASYTTADEIELRLGASFTPEQTEQAEHVAAAATAFIDRYTGRTWQTVSPVTGEMTLVMSDKVYLAHHPVTAVSAVSVHPGAATGTWTLLDAAEYELFDPLWGLLLLPLGYAGYGARIDYTFTAEVPADIIEAATLMAASQLARTLGAQQASTLVAAHPELAGLESVAVGQNDVAIRLSASTISGGTTLADASWAPPGSVAREILDSYRRPVLA